MKKIFSSILALAMMLSIATFTVQAADLSGSYSISYVDESDAPVDLTQLKADDIFYVLATINNAASMKTAALTLTWDSSVIIPVAAGGTAYGKFTDAVPYRVHTKVKNDDDENVYTAVKTELTDTSVRYEIYTTANEDLISGSKTFLKLRVKVIKTGNANLQTTFHQMMEAGMSEAVDAVCTIPTLTIGSSTPVTPPAGGDDDTTEQKAKATATYKTGMTGIRFNVSNGDKTVGYAVKFAENTQLEAASNVSIGLTVTGIPSGKSVTITAENYYDSVFGKLAN